MAGASLVYIGKVDRCDLFQGRFNLSDLDFVQAIFPKMRMVDRIPHCTFQFSNPIPLVHPNAKIRSFYLNLFTSLNKDVNP
jgi:hypothetical protein